jgi:chromosome segregation ATPase
MVSILNNYNQIFDIIENKTSLLEDNLLVIKKENQRIVLDNIRINQKIDKVELDILKKDEKIKELKNEIQELKNEIKELKEDNKRHDIKIDNLEFKILKNKIFEALSDIINNENLEDQISEIYDDLNYLKSSRNNLCHYIRNNDSKDIKNKKIDVTVDVLKNISIETKNELISEFDNDIIKIIIDYYEKNKLFINSSNISQKELIRINNWWK